MDFISGPVIFGFCSAAATTVIFSQIKILLGLKFRGSAFLTVISGIFTNWQSIRLWDAGLGLAFIILLLLLKVLACVPHKAKQKKCNNNSQLLSEFDSNEDVVQKHLLPSSPSS
jgi:sodium-independent sulfate anion transporter 11